MGLMRAATSWIDQQRSTTQLALRALGAWGLRQVGTALAGALAVGLVIGLATVLIPNAVFDREIPPVAWDFPVWICSSVLAGMLLATYVRPPESPAVSAAARPAPPETKKADERGSRMGLAGTMLAWFAVGCPVCNKVVLLLLGSAGAMQWFAPVQPVLAAVALTLTTVALVWRLRGQVACPTPIRQEVKQP